MLTSDMKTLACLLAWDTFRLLKQDALIPSVTISWSHGFTRKMGQAQYIKNRKHAVRFSVPLWPLATEEQRREIVLHEVCHIVDFHLAATQPGYFRDGIHGRSWKRLMAACGAKGDRCHSVKRPPELRKAKSPRFEASCPCRVHLITATLVRRMVSGHTYHCKSCKGRIQIVPTKIHTEPLNVLVAASSDS